VSVLKLLAIGKLQLEKWPVLKFCVLTTAAAKYSCGAVQTASAAGYPHLTNSHAKSPTSVTVMF